MKAMDLMRECYRWTDDSPGRYTKTCDQLKWGDPAREVTQIAVAMFATPEVMRAAAAWGAQLLIVHEPVFYDHWDCADELDAKMGIRYPLIQKKRQLIDALGLTVYRWHDHPHEANPDWISSGQCHFWRLRGTWKRGPFWAVNEFELEQPATAKKIADELEKSLDLHHIKICGNPETICRKLGLCFGTPGHVEDELVHCDAVLTGEICEWSVGEYVRDLNQLGGDPKAVLVMGHIGSERGGMRLLAEKLPTLFPDIPARYFECGEVYSQK